MNNQKVLPHDDWVAARKALLAKEKDFTRARDALSKERRQMPWEKIEKDYIFDGPDGNESLSGLFDGRSQLIVYHFMYGPGWEVGCKSCSYLADHFNPAVVHLKDRDVTMVAVSRAPLNEFEPFRKRMGWTFKWVSSFNNDFNRDFSVSFTQDEDSSASGPYPNAILSSHARKNGSTASRASAIVALWVLIVIWAPSLLARISKSISLSWRAEASP